jgi:hypothetical protein
MIQTHEPAASPAIPPDVAAFAARQGVSNYLPGVVALARRLFPQAPLTVRLEEDPEIAADWHIVLEADITGLSVPELLTAQNRWSSDLFDLCPAVHAPIFRLGMV